MYTYTPVCLSVSSVSDIGSFISDWQDGEVQLVLLDQMEDQDFLESPIYLVYLAMWAHLVLMEYQVMQHCRIFSGDV